MESSLDLWETELRKIMTAYKEEVVACQAHQVTEVSLDAITSGLKNINDMIRRWSEFWLSLSEDKVGNEVWYQKTQPSLRWSMAWRSLTITSATSHISPELKWSAAATEVDTCSWVQRIVWRMFKQVQNMSLSLRSEKRAHKICSYKLSTGDHVQGLFVIDDTPLRNLSISWSCSVFAILEHGVMDRTAVTA